MASIAGHGPKLRTFKGAIDGKRIWWVAPSYPTLVASNIWKDLKRATRDAATNTSETDRTITLPGGGTIAIRSADDPDSLRGPGLDGLIVDEAAFLSVEAWQSALRPALADKQGWAMLQSTPNGRNWFYKLFNDAKDREGWMRWQLPSSDNPLMTSSEIESLKLDLGPRKFAQEHEAQFTEAEGAMWPASYFGESIWCTEWPDAFEFSVIAVDPSIGANELADYSAIVFVGLCGGLLYVDANIARRDPGKIVRDTIGEFQRLMPEAVGIEADGFQQVLKPLFDMTCNQMRLPPLPLHLIWTEGVKKEVRVERLDPYLANGKLRFADSLGCNMLVEQLMMFPLKAYKRDGPDALEMAVRLLNHIAFKREETEEYVTA